MCHLGRKAASGVGNGIPPDRIGPAAGRRIKGMTMPRNLRRESERAALEQAVADYYSSQTASEWAEQAGWGEFALRQLAEREEGSVSSLGSDGK